MSSQLAQVYKRETGRPVLECLCLHDFVACTESSVLRDVFPSEIGWRSVYGTMTRLCGLGSTMYQPCCESTKALTLATKRFHVLFRTDCRVGRGILMQQITQPFLKTSRKCRSESMSAWYVTQVILDLACLNARILALFRPRSRNALKLSAATSRMQSMALILPLQWLARWISRGHIICPRRST